MKQQKQTPAQNTEEKKRPVDIARETLKCLSLEVKDLVKDGTFFTINDAIMETMYKSDTHRVFKSYRQWQAEGYQVRKGEKAFILWGRPTSVQKQLEGKTDEDIENMMKYFPIAYIFSNAQVDKAEEEPAPAPVNNEPEKINLEPLEY